MVFTCGAQRQRFKDDSFHNFGDRSLRSKSVLATMMIIYTAVIPAAAPAATSMLRCRSEYDHIAIFHLSD